MLKIIGRISSIGLIFLCQFTYAASIKYPRFEFAQIAELTSKRCTKPVEYLLEGMEVPCTGYLFSPEKEYKVRLMNESYTHLEQYIATQDKLIGIMNQRVTNLNQYNTELSKELKKQENLTFWKTSVYFILGVVVTGAISANVK